MIDELISFETAKLAKEKGFNESCRDIYDSYSSTDKIELFENIHYPDTEDTIGAPTQSLLQRWLREVHSIILVCLFSYVTDRNKYYYEIHHSNKLYTNLVNDKYNDTYEEALEEGLQEALKLIK